MDMDKYESLLNNWIPKNEEETKDQQKYIKASMELKYMDIKEKLDDDVYQRMYKEVLKSEERLTDEQKKEFRLVEQFENNHIRQSVYDAKVEELAQILNDIDDKYGISQQQQVNEFEEEVERKRKALRAYQVYNYNNGQYGVMRNVNVDNLSNNEVMEMYNTNSVISNFEEHVRLGNQIIETNERNKKEEEINKRKNEVKRTIDELKTANEEKSNVNPSNVTDKPSLSEIEAELKVFNSNAKTIKNQMDEVNRKLVLGDMTDLNVTEAINGLDTEISELREMGKVILDDMDEFRRTTESADFSMSPSEVKKTVDGFTSRFKDLKVMHQAKYNARVDYTNSKIDELKAMPDLDDEVRAMVDSLTKLDRSDNVIKSYNQKNYLNNIDYNRLVEVNKQIADIQNRLGVKSIADEEVEGLEAEMAEIERQLGSVESELETELSDDRIAQLNQDLNLTYNSINDFEQKLELNKDKLTEEEYNNYKKRLEDANSKLNELRNKLGKNVTLTDDYKDLEDKVNILSDDVDRLNTDVEALYGHIVESGKLVFEGRAKDLKDRLDVLVNEIESKKDNMDPNQYNSLKNRIASIETKLGLVNDKVKDPGMIKDADIFALLNGEIDGLEQALTSLETQVDKLEKPIKKEDGKKIDTIVKHLEKEINRLSKLAEQYKEKDPDKYNAIVERLNGLKDRLDKVGKVYRSKCPLMVKAVKSAKNFFKKHKKACLIIAGLSAFALVSHQVLIPAIMHGNIMIAGTSPALRPFIKFTDKILGGMIGATKDSAGIWKLASGVVINPSCAASSLLKGLAISGISSTALVAPVVVAVKKLVEKMKVSDLKNKFGEVLDKEKKSSKEKLIASKDALNAAKEKLKKAKDPNKKTKLMTEEDAKKILVDYRKNSGKMSFEEYVASRELSEEELNFLKSYIVMMEKNISEENAKESNASSRRRGK